LSGTWELKEKPTAGAPYSSWAGGRFSDPCRNHGSGLKHKTPYPGAWIRFNDLQIVRQLTAGFLHGRFLGQESPETTWRNSSMAVL